MTKIKPANIAGFITKYLCYNNTINIWNGEVKFGYI